MSDQSHPTPPEITFTVTATVRIDPRLTGQETITVSATPQNADGGGGSGSGQGSGSGSGKGGTMGGTDDPRRGG